MIWMLCLDDFLSIVEDRNNVVVQRQGCVRVSRLALYTERR